MRVAVSWSGGLESSLACNKVIKEGHDVVLLVTFVLDKYWPAMGHPPEIMKIQSKAMGIPHILVRVDEPFKEGYRKAIFDLMKTRDIEGIVTGDIYVVDEIHGNWMESVCAGLDIEVIMPLWNQDTLKVLNEEMSEGFGSVFTCVKKPWFNEEWIGKELNKDTVDDLLILVKEKGIDPCGENGEYHTMVVDGPFFKQRIEIPEYTREKTDTRFFMKIKK